MWYRKAPLGTYIYSGLWGSLHSNGVRPCKYFYEVDLYQERKDSFIAYEDRVSMHVLSFIFHDPIGPHPMMHFFFPFSLTWGGRVLGVGKEFVEYLLCAGHSLTQEDSCVFLLPSERCRA